MRYFAHTPSSIDTMLKLIGKNTIEELFQSIPADATKSKLSLPAPLDELALKRELGGFGAPFTLVNFIGAGASEHFVPEWVSQQLLRAEWYTSYTPYQPEVSQGTLQAIFEFQSMVASLFGLDIANGSMYDGATALAEALLMAVRCTGRRSVVVSSLVHPEYRETVKSYLDPANIRIIEIAYQKSGLTNFEQIITNLENNDIAAVAIQSPNFFGRIEETKKIAQLAHRHQTFLVGCTTDMSSAALLTSWGECEADIAVGEGLGLVGALNLGGPGVGLFACKKALVRQMPGRLVGQTVDKHFALGYTLTLSTREQHIRREKATSNICTNHNLMALAFSMCLAAYGQTGLVNLAKANLKKTGLFRSAIQRFKLQSAFIGPSYNESVINLGSESLLVERLKKARVKNLVGGLRLSRFYPELSGHLLVNTTELHTDEQINQLAEVLGGA